MDKLSQKSLGDIVISTLSSDNPSIFGKEGLNVRELTAHVSFDTLRKTGEAVQLENMIAGGADGANDEMLSELTTIKTKTKMILEYAASHNDTLAQKCYEAASEVDKILQEMNDKYGEDINHFLGSIHTMLDTSPDDQGYIEKLISAKPTVGTDIVEGFTN